MEELEEKEEEKGEDDDEDKEDEAVDSKIAELQVRQCALWIMISIWVYF